MAEEALPPQLFSRIERAADIVGRHDFIRIVSHYDADGITAAGVLANAMRRAGKEFHISLEKVLEPPVIDSLREEGPDCLVLADMGSAYLDDLAALDSDVVVLDHHGPMADHDGLVHVNPHIWGIDGMTSGCGATVSFLFAVAMDEANWESLPIAMAGMVGDMQHLEPSGINAYLVDEGQRRGLIEMRKGSLLPPGDLETSLVRCWDPFIIGVSGDPMGARALMQEASIQGPVTADGLDAAMHQRLSSLVALRLIEQGCGLKTLRDVSREHIWLPSWGMDAEELSALVNACGRTDNEGLGLAMTMGDVESQESANALLLDYRAEVMEGLLSLSNEGLFQEEAIQYFYNDRSGYGGILCGICMQYIGDSGKPTFALSVKDDGTRVSGRATFDLLDSGVDLSEALRTASRSVGGAGGGHRIASGASVPRGREKEFLKELDHIVADQIAN